MAYPEFIQQDIETWFQKFRFSTPIKVRFGETDAFGHVNNVSFFTYFEQARLEYFDYLNLLETILEPSHESLIVTANLECHYLSQLFYGQTIDVYVRTSKIGNSSFDLEYAVKEQKLGSMVAVGRGTIVYIDIQTNRSKALPQHSKEILASFEMNECQNVNK